MKGLLLKDFYAMKSSLLFWIILMLIVFFYPFIYIVLPYEDDPAFVTIFIIVSMMVMLLIIKDKKDGWRDYSTAMAVTKEQYVTAKYIFMMIINVIMILLIALSICCKNIFLSNPDWAEDFLDVYIRAGSYMIASAAVVPTVFAENIFKRSAYDYVILGSILIVVLGIMLIGVTLADILNGVLGLTVLFIIVAACYIASWHISVALYEGRIVRE